MLEIVQVFGFDRGKEVACVNLGKAGPETGIAVW